MQTLSEVSSTQIAEMRLNGIKLKTILSFMTRTFFRLKISAENFHEMAGRTAVKSSSMQLKKKRIPLFATVGPSTRFLENSHTKKDKTATGNC
jgi:hypothetical protein